MTAALSTQALSALMPMHVLLRATGHIEHAGPTLGRLVAPSELLGRRFLEVFEVQRPGKVHNMGSLVRASDESLHLRLRAEPDTRFKGQVVSVGEDGGLLVNLSFGIGIVAAVRSHALTAGDFAPTDLAVEMLYLVEAKSAIMQELRQLNTRLEGAKFLAEERANTDALTGLGNRRALDLVLSRLLRADAVFAIMQLDLDFFKSVNDRLGHAAGDVVLQAVARVLTEETREGDSVARTGGDEFTIVFPGLIDADNLCAIGSRIISRLELPIPYGDTECRISASIGVTMTGTTPEADAARLLSDADLALYASKYGGRAQLTLYTEDLHDRPVGTGTGTPPEQAGRGRAENNP